MIDWSYTKLIINLYWIGVLLIFWIVDELKGTDQLIYTSVVLGIQAEEDDTSSEEASVTHQEVLDHQVLSVPTLDDKDLQIGIWFTEMKHEQLKDDG